MATHAYQKFYLNDAQHNLGVMFDYSVRVLNYDADKFFLYFIQSQIAQKFEHANPKYIAGLSGIELCERVLLKMGEQIPFTDNALIQEGKEFWLGWIMAYYQWNKNKSYAWLFDRGLSLSEVIRMYILHEADVSAFTEAADRIIQMDDFRKESTLRRLRTYYNLTQKQLSEQSGVSLRMIQLYEQGQNDLKKAQAQVVLALADTLHCGVQELLE